MEYKPIDCPGCGTTFMPNQWQREQNNATHLGCHLHQAAPALLEALEEVMQVAFDGPKEPVDSSNNVSWKVGIEERARAAIEAAK